MIQSRSCSYWLPRDSLHIKRACNPVCVSRYWLYSALWVKDLLNLTWSTPRKNFNWLLVLTPTSFSSIVEPPSKNVVESDQPPLNNDWRESRETPCQLRLLHKTLFRIVFLWNDVFLQVFHIFSNSDVYVSYGSICYVIVVVHTNILHLH